MPIFYCRRLSAARRTSSLADPSRMTPHARKWLSRIVRLTVTVAAIFYLYTKVAWYDQATLAADPGKSYRLLGRPTADPLQLEDPSTGRRFTAAASELATLAQT